MKLERFIFDNKFPIFWFNLLIDSIISLFCLVIEFGIFIRLTNWHKIKIIIDELASSLIYESNLISYLDTNVKLLDYEITDKVIKLNFNDVILSDITNNLILEEVMYTIGLSLCDELDLEEVIFNVNNREISTFFNKNS